LTKFIPCCKISHGPWRSKPFSPQNPTRDLWGDLFMIYGSVCSGIEAATVAWHPLGWKAAWFSEIEPFTCSVLKHHYPDVPNIGDMTKILHGGKYDGPAIDLLVGGTPCQSFSIAGLRAGLADPSGNLALVFLALLDAIRPRWVVWENVPGVLSSWSDDAGSFTREEDGCERGWQSNDFDIFTSGLRKLGYGVAWRVLDAKYFGVPQRRRRVFVVGYLGDWRRAAAVLFEYHSLQGHPASSREVGKGLAPDVGFCVTARGGSGRCDPTAEVLLPVTHSLRGEGFDASEDGTGRGTPIIPILAFDPNHKSNPKPGGPYPPILKSSSAPIILYAANQSTDDKSHPLRTHTGEGRPVVFQPGQVKRKMGGQKPSEECRGTLCADMGDQHPCVAHRSQVRRLTPRECERLQGFPDDYTLIPFRGKPAADGPRYKAIGNSMAVPVIRWIGQRIDMVENIDNPDSMC
jgi:DNA (cytosine-5)-methyltransferase 1